MVSFFFSFSQLLLSVLLFSVVLVEKVAVGLHGSFMSFLLQWHLLWGVPLDGCVCVCVFRCWTVAPLVLTDVLLRNIKSLSLIHSDTVCFFYLVLVFSVICFLFCSHSQIKSLLSTYTSVPPSQISINAFILCNNVSAPLILMSLCFEYELLSFYPGESLLFKRGANINETNLC